MWRLPEPGLVSLPHWRAQIVFTAVLASMYMTMHDHCDHLQLSYRVVKVYYSLPKFVTGNLRLLMLCHYSGRVLFNLR